MKIIDKVALAVFKDKKLLVVKAKKDTTTFINLGGKREQGESDIECLKREVKEEISCEIEHSSIQFIKEFIGPAHNFDKSVILKMRLYTGNLIGEPIPSREIAEIGFIDSNTNEKEVSEIGKTMILPYLKEKGYIN